MMNVELARKNLGFSSNVEIKFQFLVDEYHFQMVEKEYTIVRYESDRVFVNIYHGRSSYELGFECGLKEAGRDSRYRLPTVLRGLLGREHNKQTFLQASEKETVSSSLEKMAELVRKHCGPLLRGETLAFTQVERASGDESEELGERYTVGPIRDQAEKAWVDKDYEKVKLLYDSIKDSLSTIEIKRLEFACKNLKKS